MSPGKGEGVGAGCELQAGCGPLSSPRLPLAKLAIRVGLAVLGSLLGAFLTFPGLRLAQTHRDALTMSEDRPMLQLSGGPGAWEVRKLRGQAEGMVGGAQASPCRALAPRFLLHTSFLSPLFILWLWTKPIARDLLHQAPFGETPFSLCVWG